MGIVVETGAGVTLVEKGDRVVMPFNVSSGGIIRFLDQACGKPRGWRYANVRPGRRWALSELRRGTDCVLHWVSFPGFFHPTPCS
jgi:threonine dehydrogenase-like Zn-dependent dehydrogenase